MCTERCQRSHFGNILEFLKGISKKLHKLF